MTLLKATLCEVSADAAGTEVGTPVDVQFNPTTLRVQISNKTAGGAQAGSQPKQKAGEGTTTLSLELVFDSADEGTTESPVPVTKKTLLVEKFVRPRGTQPSQQTPPRVQFKWNGFVMKGVMESLSVDIDHFAEDGTPLRAKCAISIKGQDPSYAYKEGEGEGAGAGAKPPTPAQAAAGAGAAPTPDKIAPALDGESLSQFAARMGLDPSAWRALADGISNPLSLSAGVEIAFSSSLNLSVGVGVSAGVSLGADADVSAKVGLDAASGTSSGAADVTERTAAAKALTEAGGVAAAITAVKQAQNNDQVAATKQSFGNAAGATAARASQRASTAGAAAVSAATEDARAYGAGVPLRPLRAIPVPDSIGGYIVAGKRVTGGAPPITRDPTVPAWVALPATAAGRWPASRGGVRHRPSVGCGCASCGGKS
jgi:hypothetical protein